MQFLTEFYGSEDQKKGSNKDEREADQGADQAADGEDGEDDSRDEGNAHGFGRLSADEILRLAFKVFDRFSPVAAVSGFSDGFLGHLHINGFGR